MISINPLAGTGLYQQLIEDPEWDSAKVKTTDDGQLYYEYLYKFECTSTGTSYPQPKRCELISSYSEWDGTLNLMTELNFDPNINECEAKGKDFNNHMIRVKLYSSAPNDEESNNEELNDEEPNNDADPNW